MTEMLEQGGEYVIGDFKEKLVGIRENIKTHEITGLLKQINHDEYYLVVEKRGKRNIYYFEQKAGQGDFLNTERLDEILGKS